MVHLQQRRELEQKLDLGAPRIVFTVGEKPQALAEGEVRFALDTKFDRLPLDVEQAHIVLEPVATTLSLRELRSFLHRCSRLLKVGGQGHLVLANPDLLRQLDPGAWPGQKLSFEGQSHHYRPWRQWWELLRLFPLEPLTPIPIPISLPGSALHPKFLWLRFEKVCEQSALADEYESDDQKYGERSSYRNFDRLEEPEIFDDWCYAASKLRPEAGETVLSLGCNDGREFEMFSPEQQSGVRFVGVDISASAIDSARKRSAHEFHCHDVMDLQALGLAPVQVVLLLNVLQCTHVDRDALLKRLMSQVSPDARLLISVPNCHFGARDILRRPLDRSSKRHDRGLVQKDLRYLTRFFYRQGYSTIESFGTYDSFLLIQR